MIQTCSKFNRVFALAGILFLFSGCASRIKPWKFQDVFTADVQILNTRQWSSSIKKDLAELDPIMKKELRYYLDNDLRIYERLEPNYELMELSVYEVDSLTKDLIRLVRKMKKYSSGELDSIPPDTNISYRKMMKKLSINIQKSQTEYEKGKDELNQGFKKVQKRILYVTDEALPLKKDLYILRYKRDLLQPHIANFNKILNESLFENSGSAHSNHIKDLSQSLEKYRIELDSFERFLSNIDKVAKKEAGGNVILTAKKDAPMKYLKKYEDGKESYLDILKDIRTITESI